MPYYHIWTIGCQMNKAESERLAGLFEELGYSPADSAEEADVIVLNSCVVRQSAENKVRNKLHALRSLKKNTTGLTLAVTGCLVESDTAELKKSFPFVDHFFMAGDSPPWLEKKPVLPATASVTAYVPIIQGCNNMCAYCIVPYRRGRERSRPLDEIVCEVEGLVRCGVKEVTLLGQNVDSYGHDLPDKPDLTVLLERLNAVQGLYRIRFLTNHPKDMSDRLIGAIARLDRVCEQLSLPVQAGDDEILRAMRRGYTAEQFRRLVARIRETVPEIALSTDVIVGFPGETEEQFRRTYDLLEELRFDVVHAAANSTRPGTIAARSMEDSVPAGEKAARLKLVEDLQEKIAGEINAGLLGKTVEVLVEGKVKGKWQGRTRSDKLVFFSSANNFLGQVAKVNIEKTSPWSLQGEAENTSGG